jgi:hypothetical protein
MTKKVFQALGCLVLLSTVLVGFASADQITIGPSVANDYFVFKNTAGTTTLGFGGSASAGGTQLTGVATYPNMNPFTGTYTFTFGSGTLPTLSLVSPFSYNVTMGTAVLNLKVCIVTCANEVDGIVDITQVSSFNPKAPQISGALTVTKSTGILFNDFAIGPGAVFDLDANMSKINPVLGVDYVYTHPRTSVDGGMSSGEVIGVPTPEPGTMALMGSGLLGLAGVLRRKREWFR